MRCANEFLLKPWVGRTRSGISRALHDRRSEASSDAPLACDDSVSLEFGLVGKPAWMSLSGAHATIEVALSA